MVLLAHAQRLGQRHETDEEPGYEEDREHDKKVEAVVRNLENSQKKAARRSRTLAEGATPEVIKLKQRDSEPQTVAKRIFGIGPAYGTVAASRLVHPASPFHTVWVGITAAFLIYTAIVTPAVISFHWLDAECSTVPTLYFDCVLDTFFLMDILYSFCVGVNYMGQYYDDWKWVARNYLTGSCLFDVCTSIPVSYVELMAQFACARAAAQATDDASGVSTGIDAQQLRFIRAMKPLRWFKLARVMKLKASGNRDLFTQLMDIIMIAPQYQRMIGVFGSIAICIHLAACGSWLVKVLTNEAWEVDNFLESLSQDPEAPIDLSTGQGKLETYVICAYFTTTVFSTVGFGDISPGNTGERIMGILLMLSGILIFGNLLADLAEINHAANSHVVEKLEKSQQAVELMSNYDVPRSVQMAVLEWIRFHHTHVGNTAREKALLTKMPSSLQQRLILCIFGDTLLRIPIFEFLGAADDNFLREVWSCMRYTTYEPNATIISFGDEASRLIVILRGKCEVCIDTHNRHEPLADITMTTGDFVGEFAILGDTNWGSSMAIGVENCDVEMAVCNNNFVVCMELERHIFGRVISSHSIKMQRVVDVFKRNRQEHKEAFRETFNQTRALAQVGVGSLQRLPVQDRDIDRPNIALSSRPGSADASAHLTVEYQRKEMKDFVREVHLVCGWDSFANRLLQKARERRLSMAREAGAKGSSEEDDDDLGAGMMVMKMSALVKSKTFTSSARLKEGMLNNLSRIPPDDVAVHLMVGEEEDDVGPLSGGRANDVRIGRLESQMTAMQLKIGAMHDALDENRRFQEQTLGKLDLLLQLAPGPHHVMPNGENGVVASTHAHGLLHTESGEKVVGGGYA